MCIDGFAVNFVFIQTFFCSSVPVLIVFQLPVILSGAYGRVTPVKGSW